MKQKVLMVAYSFVFVVFVFQSTVYAYIDPGSVSAVIQAVAACFLIGGTAVGIFFNRIKAFFSKKKEKNENMAPNEEQQGIK